MIRKQMRELIDTYGDGRCLFIERGCEYKHENGWCIESDSCYNCLMKHLGELGVVRKMDKPEPKGCSIIPNTNAICPYKEAGYEAVEPLIKEGR